MKKVAVIPGDGAGKEVVPEAVKVLLMVVLLWIALAAYRDVVAIGLIGTFIATVLIFTMAILVREK